MDPRRVTSNAAFLISLVAIAALGWFLRPRIVYEPWVAEELSDARLRALGLADPPGDGPAGPGVPEGAAPAAVPEGVFPPVSENARLFDADGDGDLDLFSPGEPGVASRLRFHLNDGDGAFREVGELLGPAFTTPRSVKTASCADPDRDGRIDLVLVLEDGSVVVLWNRLARDGAESR